MNSLIARFVVSRRHEPSRSLTQFVGHFRPGDEQIPGLLTISELKQSRRLKLTGGRFGSVGLAVIVRG